MIAAAWMTSSRVIQGMVKQISQFLELSAINKYVVLYFHSPVRICGLVLRHISYPLYVYSGDSVPNKAELTFLTAV